MNKLLYILLFLIISEVPIFAQTDFYSTDSSTHAGIKLIDGGDRSNSSYCVVKKMGKEIKFTPYQIKTYGFKDGRLYFSKEISVDDSIKRVFIEFLAEGRTNLFYFKGKKEKIFFTQKDSSAFVQIPKQNYKSKISDITSDCDNVKDAAKLMRFNKRSMTKFINRYNKCELKSFPFFKYGLVVGYKSNTLAPGSINDEFLNQIDYSKDWGYTAGIFIDVPILVSDFSIHTELYFSQHGFSYNKLIKNNDFDLVVNTSTLNLPILLKYSVPLNKIRPYINSGICLAYNIKNKNNLYKATTVQNIVNIESNLYPSFISKKEIGYSAGAGIECKLSYKSHLFFEFRCTKLYGISDSESFNNSQIQLLTGINF